MGFDDEVYDNEVKEKIIEALKPLIGLYDYEDWDDLEGMEEGYKVYCPYSLIYRQLYNLSQVFFAGSHPPHLRPSDEMVARNKLMTRKEALQLMYDNQNDDDESDDDDEEGPILKLLLDTKGQIDVIEEKIRSMRTEYKQ